MKYSLPLPKRVYTKPNRTRAQALNKRQITESQCVLVKLTDDLIVERYSLAQVRVYYKGKEWKGMRRNTVIVALLEHLHLQESTIPTIPIELLKEVHFHRFHISRYEIDIADLKEATDYVDPSPEELLTIINAK